MRIGLTVHPDRSVEPSQWVRNGSGNNPSPTERWLCPLRVDLTSDGPTEAGGEDDERAAAEAAARESLKHVVGTCVRRALHIFASSDGSGDGSGAGDGSDRSSGGEGEEGRARGRFDYSRWLSSAEVMKVDVSVTLTTMSSNGHGGQVLWPPELTHGVGSSGTAKKMRADAAQASQRERNRDHARCSMERKAKKSRLSELRAENTRLVRGRAEEEVEEVIGAEGAGSERPESMLADALASRSDKKTQNLRKRCRGGAHRAAQALPTRRRRMATQQMAGVAEEACAYAVSDDADGGDGLDLDLDLGCDSDGGGKEVEGDEQEWSTVAADECDAATLDGDKYEEATSAQQAGYADGTANSGVGAAVAPHESNFIRKWRPPSAAALKAFDKRVAQVREFHELNGHTNIPFKICGRQSTLAPWWCQVRKEYRLIMREYHEGIHAVARANEESDGGGDEGNEGEGCGGDDEDGGEEGGKVNKEDGSGGREGGGEDCEGTGADVEVVAAAKKMAVAARFDDCDNGDAEAADPSDSKDETQQPDCPSSEELERIALCLHGTTRDHGSVWILSFPGRIAALRSLLDSARLWKKRRRRHAFEEYLRKLREYKNIHGHCDVPQYDRELGKFVMRLRTTRRLYREGKDGPYRWFDAEAERRLEEIGFKWVVRTQNKPRTFEERVEELRNAMKAAEEEEARERRKWEEEKEDGESDGSGSSPRRRPPTPRQVLFERVRSPGSRFGRSYSGGDKGLKDFLQHQVRCYRDWKEGKPSPMTEERAKALEEAGASWDLEENRFLEKVEVLRDFHERHGHLNNMTNHRTCKDPLDSAVLRIICDFRQQYRLMKEGKPFKSSFKGPLTQEQAERLEELGLRLKDPEEGKFDEMVAAVLKFRSLHGHADISEDEPHPLGTYARKLRETYDRDADSGKYVKELGEAASFATRDDNTDGKSKGEQLPMTSLRPRHVLALRGAGFCFYGDMASPVTFQSKQTQVRTYKAGAGHTNVQEDHPTLRSWTAFVREQHSELRRGKPPN